MVMCSILFVARIVLLWTDMSKVVSLIFELLFKFGVTAPKAPITTGATDALTLHSFYFLFQLLVFWKFLMFLFSDVTVTWDAPLPSSPACRLPQCQYCLMVSHYLSVSLDMEFPQCLLSSILQHTWWHLPL